MEQRTQIVPGEAPMTILRHVDYKNGCGKKEVVVMKGSKIVSSVREPLNATECSNVETHTFTKKLFKSANRKTKKKMNKKRA